MGSDEIIHDVLTRQNIKQRLNVVELYLGNHQLRTVHTLERFRMLRTVWLNSNKLRNLSSTKTHQSFLKNNFRVTELYLQNNEINDIKGALSHLSCLEVLMLQKNQLANPIEVLQELATLQTLRVLSLFDNPLAQEPGYRLSVIHTLPSVEILDRRVVTKKERQQAREIHAAQREAVKATVAFGRRATINPSLLHTLNREPLSHHRYSKNAMYQSPKREIISLKREAYMQYTTFDWSKMPTSQERRLGTKVPLPQNLTVKFR